MANVSLPSPIQIGVTLPQADRPLPNFGEVSDALNQRAEAAANFGRGLSQVGGAIQDVQDKLNFAAANGQFLQKKLQLDQQFETDTNYATKPQRYAQAISDIANQTASTINSADLRSEFIDRTMRWQAYGIEGMQHQARQQAVDADRSFINDSFNSTIDTAVRAPDEPTRIAVFRSFADQADALVAKNSLTQTEADRLKQNLATQYAVGKAKTLVDTDPGLAARLLSPTAPALTPNVPADVGAAIHRASVTHDVPEDWLARTAQVEGDGTSETGATGRFQFLPSTARQYGVSNPRDPMQAADGAARLYNDNKATLTATLGRDPTGPELYLAHQQGAAGAAALLEHPDLPANVVLASVRGDQQIANISVTANGGSLGMKAGDFAALQEQRFAGGAGAAQPGPAPQTDASGAVIYPKTGDWRDMLPQAERAQLAVEAVNRADVSQRASLADAERQLALQEKIRTAQSNQALDEYGKQIFTDPTKLNFQAIASDKRLDFNALKDVIGTWRTELNKEVLTKDLKDYGPKFWDIAQRVNAPDNDPNRISNAADLWKFGPTGDLTMAGISKLSDVLTNRKTGQGQIDEATRTSFFADMKKQITGSDDLLHKQDKRGDALWTAALPVLWGAWDAARHPTDGKSQPVPTTELVDPKSPHYLGKVVGPGSQFYRTPAQRLLDEQDIVAPEPKVIPGAPTLDQLFPKGQD